MDSSDSQHVVESYLHKAYETASHLATKVVRKGVNFAKDELRSAAAAGLKEIGGFVL